MFIVLITIAIMLCLMCRGNTCAGTVKRLYVQMTCSKPSAVTTDLSVPVSSDSDNVMITELVFLSHPHFIIESSF